MSITLKSETKKNDKLEKQFNFYVQNNKISPVEMCNVSVNLLACL
jgi:hypothetical protein